MNTGQKLLKSVVEQEFLKNLKLACSVATILEYPKKDIYKVRKELENRFYCQTEFIKLSHVKVEEIAKVFKNLISK